MNFSTPVIVRSAIGLLLAATSLTGCSRQPAVDEAAILSEVCGMATTAESKAQEAYAKIDMYGWENIDVRPWQVVYTFGQTINLTIDLKDTREFAERIKPFPGTYDIDNVINGDIDIATQLFLGETVAEMDAWVTDYCS